MSKVGCERLYLREPEFINPIISESSEPTEFLTSSVEDWLQFLSEPLTRAGASLAEARAFATVVVAGFRGFMLDYCASHDRKRLDRAVELWIRSLDSIAPHPKNSSTG